MSMTMGDRSEMPPASRIAEWLRRESVRLGHIPAVRATTSAQDRARDIRPKAFPSNVTPLFTEVGCAECGAPRVRRPWTARERAGTIDHSRACSRHGLPEAPVALPEPRPVSALPPSGPPEIGSPPASDPPTAPWHVLARYRREITGPHGWVAVRLHTGEWRWTVAMSKVVLRPGRVTSRIVWVRNPHRTDLVNLISWPGAYVHWPEGEPS